MSILKKVAGLIVPVEQESKNKKDENRPEGGPAPDSAGAILASFLLLLDNSGSMSRTDFSPSRIQGAVNAALEMVRYLARNAPQCLVGIGTFADKFHLCINPTPAGSGHREIAASLEDLGDSGNTEMVKGLKGIRKMAGRGPDDYRTVVLILTDGHNTGSCPLPVADDLKGSGADIWAVGIGGDRSDVDEDLLLQMVSSEDNYFFIGNWEGPEAIARTFRKVAYTTLLSTGKENEGE